MSEQELSGYIQIAQLLIAMGIDVGTKLKSLFTVTHPTMTDAEINAAYDAIMADDDVRAALSAKAAGQV